MSLVDATLTNEQLAAVFVQFGALTPSETYVVPPPPSDHPVVASLGPEIHRPG